MTTCGRSPSICCPTRSDPCAGRRPSSRVSFRHSSPPKAELKKQNAPRREASHDVFDGRAICVSDCRLTGVAFKHIAEKTAPGAAWAPARGALLSWKVCMLKRLLLSILLLAALAGGWRPAMAGWQGIHERQPVEASRMHQAGHGDAGCAEVTHHRGQAQAENTEGAGADMSRCAAMAAGCLAPVLGAAVPEVARQGEALCLRLRDRPADRLQSVALTPNPRPPRASL